MRGVSFNGVHSADDWNLIMNAKELTPPTPKTNYVSIDGRSGDLDLTEALTDEIKYENREATYTFLEVDSSYLDREELLSEILNSLQGKRVEIIDDDAPDLYLAGRCEVTEAVNSNAYLLVNVSVNCEPYKYKVDLVTRRVIVENETTAFVCYNRGYKRVIPEIKVNGDITLTFGDYSTRLITGTYSLVETILKRGINNFTASGSGSIEISYREGIL